MTKEPALAPPPPQPPAIASQPVVGAPGQFDNAEHSTAPKASARRWAVNGGLKDDSKRGDRRRSSGRIAIVNVIVIEGRVHVHGIVTISK